jgi:hypothetical protein
MFYRSIEGQAVQIEDGIWRVNVKKLFFDPVFRMLSAGLNEELIREALEEGAKIEVICKEKVYKPIMSEEWARIGHRIKKPSIKYPGTFWYIVSFPLEQYRHKNKKETRQINLFQEGTDAEI